MKFNLKTIFLACCALFASLGAQSQNYPPYPSGSAPVFYGIYPVTVEVPYGQTSANPFTYQLQFYVVNTTTNTYNLSGYTLTASNAPANNPVTITGYSDNCKGVLGPSGKNGVCTIFANISATNPLPPNNLSPINYTFKFSYSAGRSPAVQASPQFSIAFATGQELVDAAREVTFINNCTDQDIWFGVDSGAVAAITPDPSVVPLDPMSCQDTVNSTDCYPGSKCINIQQNPTVLNHCFWENPAPISGIYKLPKKTGPRPSSNTVTFKVYDNGIPTAWNGGASARVGCSDSTSTACTVADCGANPSGSGCPVGGGFTQPSTLAEFTFLSQNPILTSTSGSPSSDTYDITLINGVTVPMSMSPIFFAKSTSRIASTDPYFCGTPGAVTQPVESGLGGCPWFDNTPPTSGLANGALQDDFVWVDVNGGGGTCVGNIDDDSCNTSGEVCGHTIVGATVSSGLVCGAQLGYLTADAVCAADSSFGAPFNCADTFKENGTKYSYNEVYGCSSGDFKNSCYSAGATSACCGCQDWSAAPYNLPMPASTQSCGGIYNGNWQALLLDTNFLPWVKGVCPTAYSYPYDDASSTFKCQDLDPVTNTNNVDYLITFCPAS